MTALIRARPTSSYRGPAQLRPHPHSTDQGQRSYSSLSTDSSALEFDISPEKTLSDYFWIPLAPNNPLFDAFVIEFEGFAPNINAVPLDSINKTLSPKHGDSSDSYSIIRSIKKKVQEAMGAMSHTGQENNVIVKYVLVSLDADRWKLPEKNWKSCKGDVYYQHVHVNATS